MLELGASVDGLSSRGQTPLLQAVVSGQPPELIVALLDAGADAGAHSTCVSACSVPDTEVIGWAMRLGSPEVIELPERHDADGPGERRSP